MPFPMSGFFAGLTVFKDRTSAYHSVWACLYILRTHVRPEVPLWQEEAHRTVQSAGRGRVAFCEMRSPHQMLFSRMSTHYPSLSSSSTHKFTRRRGLRVSVMKDVS